MTPTESGSLRGRQARMAAGAGAAELQAVSLSQFPSLRTGKMKRRDFNILKHFKIIKFYNHLKRVLKLYKL